MSLPVLLQFRASHYNERARWALDHKGVQHRRRSVLPGLHILPVLFASGQRQTPVLFLDKEKVIGSSAILERLEQVRPDPSLYPGSPQTVAEIREVSRWFDEEVGAHARRAFFHTFLRDGDYAGRFFSQGASPLVGALYRAMFPGTRAIMRLDMRIDAEGAKRGLDRVWEALDRLAKAGDGYLVGDRFSAADLTAAAMLHLVVFPPECPVTVIEPRSEPLQTWLRQFQDHPGARWVSRIYREHRGLSAEIEA